MYHTQSFKVVDMITKAEEKYYMEALSDTQPKDIHVVGTLLSKQETHSPKICSVWWVHYSPNKKRHYPTSPTQSNYLTNLSIFSVKKCIASSRPRWRCILDPIPTSLLKNSDMLGVLLPLSTKSVNDPLFFGDVPVSLLLLSCCLSVIYHQLYIISLQEAECV